MAENINTAPVQTLSGGGYFLTFTQPGTTVSLKRLSVLEVKDGIDKANTALQETSVGPMAYEDPDDWVSRAEYNALQVTLTQQIALLQTQIDDLNTMIGTQTIQVYEPGIYQPEVYVG